MIPKHHPNDIPMIPALFGQHNGGPSGLEIGFGRSRRKTRLGNEAGLLKGIAREKRKKEDMVLLYMGI